MHVLALGGRARGDAQDAPEAAVGEFQPHADVDERHIQCLELGHDGALLLARVHVEERECDAVQQAEVVRFHLHRVRLYLVAMPEEKLMLYEIEEVYAGRPEDYVLPKESSTTGLRFPIFHLLGTGLMCATLRVCSDPGIAANAVFDNVNSAQVEAIHSTSPKLPSDQHQATSMVISKLCTMQGRSCAL